MKVIYDRETDILTVILKEGKVAESDEGKPGVVLDYDIKGDLVSLEVMDASKKVSKVQNIEFQTTPA